MAEEVRTVSATGGEKGQKDARFGSLDPLAILEVAKVAGFGEKKYSRLNYMKGYDWSLSFDAGMRHRLAFWAGEDIDPESGLPHLAHAAWHDLCQLAFYLHKLGTDDRYKKSDLTASGEPFDALPQNTPERPSEQNLASPTAWPELCTDGTCNLCGPPRDEVLNAQPR